MEVAAIRERPRMASGAACFTGISESQFGDRKVSTASFEPTDSSLRLRDSEGEYGPPGSRRRGGGRIGPVRNVRAHLLVELQQLGILHLRAQQRDHEIRCGAD